MTVDFMRNLILLATAKNQQGYIAPADLNTNLQQAQLSFADYLLGQFQTYQVGRPVSRVDYSMTEKARQRLTPLIGPLVPLTIDGTGLAPYPGDYQQADAMFDSTGNNRVRYVPQHKKFSYVNSKIDPIATNPIYLIESGGFRFYPNSFGSAMLSYVKTPPAIVWGFTLDGNGLPEYDPGMSTDPVWYDIDCYEIVARALKLFGVNLELPVVMQYGEQLIREGQ
jgi:hypothetical protein